MVIEWLRCLHPPIQSSWRCFLEFFAELVSFPFSLRHTLREAGKLADLVGNEASMA